MNTRVLRIYAKYARMKYARVEPLLITSIRNEHTRSRPVKYARIAYSRIYAKYARIARIPCLRVFNDENYQNL